MYYYTRLPGAAQAAYIARFAMELIIRCFFAFPSIGVIKKAAAGF